MDDSFPKAQFQMKGFTQCEKYLNTELFLVRTLLYSVRIQDIIIYQFPNKSILGYLNTNSVRNELEALTRH